MLSVIDTLLASLRGARLWNGGESGVDEGSGDSGGPMLMSSCGLGLPLRDVGGDMVGVRNWNGGGRG